MSHFAVMVIGDDAEEQLAPYDENLELPRHVKHTKEEIIKKGKRSIEMYRDDTYAEFLKDKEAYKAGCDNPKHIEYLENEFPQKLLWTDEEIYQDEIEYEESENIGPDGEVYTTFNENAKWDWYERGGRWAGSIKLKKGIEPLEPLNFSWGWDEKEKRKAIKEGRVDIAYKKDIANIDDEDFVTFAIVKNGQWYERGGMGWWGMVRDEKDEKSWKEEFRELVRDLPDDTLISIYDCHI